MLLINSWNYKGLPLPPTLRSLSLVTVLPHSLNRWICGFAFGYAQISPYGETSHIPRTLAEMLLEIMEK